MTALSALELVHGQATLFSAVLFSQKLGVTVLIF
jgi:hypothetical protein